MSDQNNIQVAPEATEPKVFEVVSIIDRSGSMHFIAQDAIGGFNAFIETQQKVEGDANLTVVLFDNEYIVLQDRVPLADAVKLDHTNYIPRGNTALHDAVGKTIAKFKELQAAGELKGGVIISILTDGAENASKEYTAESIKKLITECEADFGWEFTFLAANQDAFEEGGKLGVKAGSTMNFVASAAGMADAMTKMSDYSTMYRSTK